MKHIKSLSLSLSKQSFLNTKKGTATGISLAFSAGIMVVSLGTVSIVNNTLNENKNTENASVSYYSTERGDENARYIAMSGGEGNELGKTTIITPGNNAKTTVEISSLSTADENNTITVPTPGNGDSSLNGDWNEITEGEASVIPLFTDNTRN